MDINPPPSPYEPLILAVWIGSIIVALFFLARHRSRMTPEERAREDAAIENEERISGDW
jgi:hypothetical protein